MRTQSKRIMLGVVAITTGIAVSAGSQAVAVPADDTSVRVKGHLRAAAPEVLRDVAPVKTSAKGKGAISATVKGVSVEVPVDPSSGVVMDSASGPSVTIGLPRAGSADNAVVVQPGIVAYDNNDGSSTAVKTVADGSVQMINTISGPKAPKAFAYTVGAGQGQRVRLAVGGGAEVADATGTIISIIDEPWAKDARGVAVKTHFSVQGNTLVQHVEHRAGMAYPVVSDPTVKRWYGRDVLFNRNATNNIMLGMTGAAMASVFIPEPVLSKLAAASLIGLSGYASWVYNRNGCVKLRVTYTGSVIPGHYYGGYCR
jgi:hypothetical protein